MTTDNNNYNLALELNNLQQINIPKLFTDNPNLLRLTQRLSAVQALQTELIFRGQSIEEYRSHQREEMIAALGAFITAINHQEKSGHPGTDNFTPEHVLLATIIAALANGAASGALTLEQPPVPISVCPDGLSSENTTLIDFISTSLYYSKCFHGETNKLYCKPFPFCLNNVFNKVIFKVVIIGVL